MAIYQNNIESSSNNDDDDDDDDIIQRRFPLALREIFGTRYAAGDVHLVRSSIFLLHFTLSSSFVEFAPSDHIFCWSFSAFQLYACAFCW